MTSSQEKQDHRCLLGYAYSTIFVFFHLSVSPESAKIPSQKWLVFSATDEKVKTAHQV